MKLALQKLPLLVLAAAIYLMTFTACQNEDDTTPADVTTAGFDSEVVLK